MGGCEYAQGVTKWFPWIALQLSFTSTQNVFKEKYNHIGISTSEVCVHLWIPKGGSTYLTGFKFTQNLHFGRYMYKNTVDIDWKLPV